MFKQRFLSFISSLENYARENFTQILAYIIIGIVIIVTFKLQDRIVGWEGSYDALQPQHHGEVSTQGLAIIVRSTWENQFVGYASVIKDDQNNLQYDYFDRYPVFFAAIFNAVLAFSTKLSVQVFIAKQVMNLIFLATLFVAFLILDKLVRNKMLSLIAVLLAFSNPFLLYYKDMIHFDQPALFGFLLLIYAIALYKIDGLKIPVYSATFVAIALGRGYASYAILILWLLLETIVILRAKESGFGQKLKSLLLHPAFFLLVAGIIWGAGLLAYNMGVEAHKRNIPIAQTSIVDSAERRLALNPTFNEKSEGTLDWVRFTETQINRIIQWSFPFSTVQGLGFYGNVALLVIMFAVMGFVIWRLAPELRIVYLLLIFSAFFWMFPLRNLTAFHDYTSMYYIGIPLGFFLAILILLKPSKEWGQFLAIGALAVYFLAIAQVKDLHEAKDVNSSAYTYDFEKIQAKIDGTGKNIFMTDKIPFGPYAFEFYLKDDYLSPLKLADYVISSNPNYLPDNLTPDNQVMFLFKTPAPAP